MFLRYRFSLIIRNFKNMSNMKIACLHWYIKEVTVIFCNCGFHYSNIINLFYLLAGSERMRNIKFQLRETGNRCWCIESLKLHALCCRLGKHSIYMLPFLVNSLIKMTRFSSVPFPIPVPHDQINPNQFMSSTSRKLTLNGVLLIKFRKGQFCCTPW